MTLIFTDGSTRRYVESTPHGFRVAATTAAQKYREVNAALRIAGAWVVSDDNVWLVEDSSYVDERDSDA